MWKLKRAKTAEPDRLAAIEEVFKLFREEAVRQKNEVKQGTRKLSDFSAWLAKKQDEADKLME